MLREGEFDHQLKVFDNAGEAIESRNGKLFFDAWKDADTDTQKQIALGLFVVEGKVFSNDLFRGLTDRYQQASLEEQGNIIRGLGTLGVKCREVEVKTIDFLLEKFDGAGQNQTVVADALNRKIVGASFPLFEGKKPLREEKEILTRIIGKFLGKLRDPNVGRDVKITIMYGISNFARIDDLKKPLDDTLRLLAQDSDKEIAHSALGELTRISKPGDPFVLDKLNEKIAGLDLADLSISQKIELIREMGIIFGSDQTDLVEQFLSDSDEIIQIEARDALKKINNRKP